MHWSMLGLPSVTFLQSPPPCVSPSVPQSLQQDSVARAASGGITCGAPQLEALDGASLCSVFSSRVLGSLLTPPQARYPKGHPGGHQVRVQSVVGADAQVDK